MTARTGRDTHDDGRYGPEITRRGQVQVRRVRHRRRIVIGACLGLLLAGFGTVAGFHFSRPSQPCASCLSITPVNDAMNSVMQAIDMANEAAAAPGRPWVGVALLNSFALEPEPDVTAQRMVDELRGAYLGQQKMNNAPGATIRVKLYLINEGSAEQNEAKAVRQLESMEKSDRIVAVAGLGLSNVETLAAAKALSADHMPMFTAVATADQFTGQTYTGLVQVTPDVTAQLNLLKATLTRPRRVILVYDAATSDLYTGDMQRDFVRDFSSSLPKLEYAYMPGSADDTSQEFNGIALEVCSPQRPPVILYAGRQSVLGQFIQQIDRAYPCQNKRIDIVTAGDADGLDPKSTAAQPDGVQVSVIYTDIIDANKPSPAFTQLYDKNGPALEDPADAGLTHPWMDTSYNMMMAASAAIESGYHANFPGLPVKSDVFTFATTLNGPYAGATGPFSIDSDGELLSSDIPIYADTAGQNHQLSTAPGSLFLP
jgi:ABC-type branched-subunit amino acid transport system substrate-binding protein